MIVAYEDQDGSMQISIRETLRLALQELFPNVPKSVFDGVGGTSSSITQSSLQFNGSQQQQRRRHDHHDHHSARPRRPRAPVSPATPSTG